VKLTVTAGQELVADTDTPTGPLDTVVGLWDSAGNLLAANDDSGGTLDSFLRFSFTVSGTYYLMVSASASARCSRRPVRLGQRARLGQRGTVRPDRDRRRAGPRLLRHRPAGRRHGRRIGQGRRHRSGVPRPGGRVIMDSQQDASFLFPPESPLPRR
jgi:hypothetical protein